MLLAGMPSPLPSDLVEVLRLHDSVFVRLQAISFFVATLLLSTLAVQKLWNSLQGDFPRLPRLSYFKALFGVLLWGLLFIVVLTMVSGARELLTPRAWEKQGFTYRLSREQTEQTAAEMQERRRRDLNNLYGKLSETAKKNAGRFPDQLDNAAISGEIPTPAFAAGLPYQYVAGLSTDDAHRILVYEPPIYSDGQLALLCSGEVELLTADELTKRLDAEDVP